MGLLSLGTPLTWQEAKLHADHIHIHGIRQFLNVFHKVKERHRDQLLWGDEIEYMMVAFDHHHKNARLWLGAASLIQFLSSSEDKDARWHPEYGRYMVEGTPGQPYGCSVKELFQVEENMRYRRSRLNTASEPASHGKSIKALTITSYPRLGVGGFTEPVVAAPNNPLTNSLFIADDLINPHARFGTLTKNIRDRRGDGNVSIHLPIYVDENTPQPFVDLQGTLGGEACEHIKVRCRNFAEERLKINHIYLDAMCFGMGCSCLQITLQACDIDEARFLYDSLVNFAPVMMALSAASPLHRGHLTDIDCRWNIVAGSVDDRTPEERGLKPLENETFVLRKSRFDSVDCYISPGGKFRPEYNDIPLVYDPHIYSMLVGNGIDELLAKHIAHFFVRDPLVVYRELLNVDDESSTDHYENIQSTNWQTVRFKLPPPNSDIGWRVEFRSMEVQTTDFENAAYAVFMILLTRAIISFNLNFYVPISLADRNMAMAQKRNAVLSELFAFRRRIFPEDDSTHVPVEEEYAFMSIDEIINGKEGGFVGIIPVINSFLNSLEVDIDSRCKLSRYLDLISKRANGSLMTNATWIRRFVLTHPEYNRDSLIPEKVNYDLLCAIEKMTEGNETAEDLFGG